MEVFQKVIGVLNCFLFIYCNVPKVVGCSKMVLYVNEDSTFSMELFLFLS